MCVYIYIYNAYTITQFTSNISDSCHEFQRFSNCPLFHKRCQSCGCFHPFRSPLRARHLQRRTTDHSWRGWLGPQGFWPSLWPRIPGNSKRHGLGTTSNTSTAHPGKGSMDSHGFFAMDHVINREQVLCL